MNLRNLIESDLATTLEGDFAQTVNLIDPDGVRHDGLLGRVQYDTVRINPETGEEMTVNLPVITLRRSSMARVPQAGENWLIEYPESPITGAAMIQRVLTATRPPEGGRSIGFIRLYPQEVEQSGFDEIDSIFNEVS